MIIKDHTMPQTCCCTCVWNTNGGF